MFGLPLFFAFVAHSPRARATLSEFVATFGLLVVIWGCSRFRSNCDRLRSRGVYYRGILVHGINLVRQSSGDAGAGCQRYFAGIRPADAPGFIAAQLVAACVAALFFRWFLPGETREPVKIESYSLVK